MQINSQQNIPVIHYTVHVHVLSVVQYCYHVVKLLFSITVLHIMYNVYCIIQAILLEFSRSVISGLLGFTIDQDGAVVKVDGLAKMRGLQKGARVLQVEDKLVCCCTHQEIVDLLHDKHRVIVKAYVIPPVQHSERYMYIHV